MEPLDLVVHFDHYLDGVFYDRRPSVWIEPKGDWGKGTVQLIEIPTDDEIHDNIVAMWVPEKPAVPGASFELSYRLHWQADEPFPTPLARCVATRLGNGGQPGLTRPKGVRKFMVEFLGESLAKLPFGVKPEPVLWASRGTFSYVFTEAVFDEVPGVELAPACSAHFITSGGTLADAAFERIAGEILSAIMSALPADGIARRPRPSSTHMETAQERPRALNDPVGFRPSSFTIR